MKLLFITPGLEPGKDAVGDYTIEIARRLLRSGYSVSIISIADRHIDIRNEGLRAGCKTIRLPKRSEWNSRWKQLKEYVQENKPGWVSLQWVAFGYQDKGLPVLFGRHLRDAIGMTPTHIMCHEIWVEADGSTSFKGRVYSQLQREVHRRCFKALRPVCIHTTTEPYKRALESIGLSADILPLGSNIHGDEYQMHAAHASDDALTFIVFGNTPPEWDVKPVIQTIAKASSLMNRKALLWFSGKGGPSEEELQSLVNYSVELGVKVKSLGFLEAQSIVEYMNRADVGLATVPFALWQKSSAVAAMRTCGLPVVFSRFDGQWPEEWLPKWEDGFFRLSESDIAQAVSLKMNALNDPWKVANHRLLKEIEKSLSAPDTGRPTASRQQ